MFDPTAFDNLKVVLEGLIYDLDFKNKIIVVDRSNLIDLAKMKRIFSISFQNQQPEMETIATITLAMDSEQLLSEMISKTEAPNCYMTIELNKRGSRASTNDLYTKQLRRLWGNSPLLIHDIKIKRDKGVINQQIKYVLEEDRIIFEEEVSVLEDLVENTIKSLQLKP